MAAMGQEWRWRCSGRWLTLIAKQDIGGGVGWRKVSRLPKLKVSSLHARMQTDIHGCLMQAFKRGHSKMS